MINRVWQKTCAATALAGGITDKRICSAKFSKSSIERNIFANVVLKCILYVEKVCIFYFIRSSFIQDYFFIVYKIMSHVTRKKIIR
jgi:hypothetical protein